MQSSINSTKLLLGTLALTGIIFIFVLDFLFSEHSSELSDRGMHRVYLENVGKRC